MTRYGQRIVPFTFPTRRRVNALRINPRTFFQCEYLISSLDLEEEIKKPVKNPLAGHDLVATQIALDGIKVSDIFWYNSAFLKALFFTF